MTLPEQGTDTNQASEDELDEILESLTTGASDGQFIDDGSIGEAKVDILDWHNKQIEEVLEEIIDHYTPYRPVLDSETQRNVRQYVSGLLAERNKLKGRQNERATS